MKPILFAFFSFFSFLRLIGQSAADAPNASPGEAQTLLWKITGKGLAKPSYLFGTMHILCAEDAKLSSGLRAVIRDCDEVYFEIDLSDMSAMMNSLKYLRMNDDLKLSDLLDSASYAKVKNYFAKHAGQIPFGMLEHFKPMLISGFIEEEDLPCKTTNGMEFIILKEVKEQGKPIHGLETAEFQASVFDSIPYKDQAMELVKYIDSGAENRSMTDTLVAAYKNQDLGKIEQLTIQEDGSTSGYLDLLLYGRNRKWVKEMNQLLPGKSLLFAVGAGHLPGEQGLIVLLRKAGYTVSPVNNR